jgi:hypothetical protein
MILNQDIEPYPSLSVPKNPTSRVRSKNTRCRKEKHWGPGATVLVRDNIALRAENPARTRMVTSK